MATHYRVKITRILICFVLLSPGILGGQTQCPADAPSGFTVEEIGDSCYIVFTWPKDEMPELTCGTPGSPLAGSSSFNGKLLNMTLESTYNIYENGSNCSGSTFNFQYHPSLADSYITTRSYCDLTVLPSVSFVCNRTQGSNFTCDQTNNGPSNAPMPIGLATFFGSSDLEGKINLHWETEWEENNELYELERSRNGKQFTPIHAQSGAGDSFLPQKYSYQDTRPFPGTNYYRLKQTDYDGQFSYSKVISVQSKAKSNWSCYPTVTEDLIYVAGKTNYNQSASIQVIDLLGRTVVPSVVLHEGENPINLSSLRAGTYIALLIEGNQVSQPHRIIKR